MLKSGKSMRKIFLAILLVFSLAMTGMPFTGPVKADAATPRDHNKQVIGYFTQWDAWKANNAGLPAQGALTHLNIDFSKYTILNFSFFGVAYDGSLHSGDYRNKNIYMPG
ncbi:MAG: hypothetical protein GXX10_06335 [Clostridiaceae bacterium]|nr:hypothetical protein [Clostridiaceae bacterium]